MHFSNALNTYEALIYYSYFTQISIHGHFATYDNYAMNLFKNISSPCIIKYFTIYLLDNRFGAVAEN
jgi:hypothetical protein